MVLKNLSFREKLMDFLMYPESLLKRLRSQHFDSLLEHSHHCFPTLGFQPPRAIRNTVFPLQGNGVMGVSLAATLLGLLPTKQKRAFWTYPWSVVARTQVLQCLQLLPNMGMSKKLFFISRWQWRKPRGAATTDSVGSPPPTPPHRFSGPLPIKFGNHWFRPNRPQ